MRLRELILTIVIFLSQNGTASSCWVHFNSPDMEITGHLEFPMAKRDMPEIPNIVSFIKDFKNTQSKWNSENPHNRNNFGLPVFATQVKAIIKSLKGIERPATLRAQAEKQIRELEAVAKAGYPYKDTFVLLVNSASIISAKFRTGDELKTQNSLFGLIARHASNVLKEKLDVLWYKKIEKFKISPSDVSVLRNGLTDRDKPGSPKWHAYTEYSQEVVLTIKGHIHTVEGAKDFKLLQELLKFKVQAAENYAKSEHMTDIGLHIFKQDIDQFEELLDPKRKNSTGQILRAGKVKLEIVGSDKWYTYNLDQLIENNLFYPVVRNQSIEGLAESFMLGMRPIELAKGLTWAHERYYNPRNFLGHDVLAHGLIDNDSFYASALLGLPFEQRIKILLAVKALPNGRLRELAYFSLYAGGHEGSDMYAGGGSVAGMKKAYVDETKKSITDDEVIWLADWYRRNVNVFVGPIQ